MILHKHTHLSIFHIRQYSLLMLFFLYLMLSIPCYAIDDTSDSALENKTETEKRIEELNEIIEISYDEMEGRTWYKHKKEMGFYGIRLYLGKTDDDIKFMRLRFATKGSDGYS